MAKQRFETGFSKGDTNKHHLFDKCLGGSNHPINLKELEIIKHRALHILLDGGDRTPLGRVQQLHNLQSQVLIQECVADINRVLNLWKQEGRDAYKPEILKKRTVLD